MQAAADEVQAAQAALRASEERFRLLFERAGDALLLLDMRSSRFIDCNVATLAMLSCASKEELLNTHPADLSPPLQPDGRPSAEKAEEMIATALRNGFHRFEWAHCSPYRAPFLVEVMLTPIAIGDQLLAITSWRDLTEAKRVERAMAASAAEAARQNEELARFNRAAIDRELRMIELKREVDELRARLGKPPRYPRAAEPEGAATGRAD